MQLTPKQQAIVILSYIRSMEGKSFEEMLAKLLKFILTHSAAEFTTEMRRVVQENRDAVQSIRDGVDVASASSKVVLDEQIADLEATDAELAS